MNARGSGIVGYNVQAAVEAGHHLVVAHDVVTTGSDRAQLSPMARAAREATGASAIEVVADRGYYSGREVLACEDAGIVAHVPKTITSNAVADGRFGKDDFVYESSSDSYRCPAGQGLQALTDQLQEERRELTEVVEKQRIKIEAQAEKIDLITRRSQRMERHIDQLESLVTLADVQVPKRRFYDE